MLHRPGPAVDRGTPDHRPRHWLPVPSAGDRARRAGCGAPLVLEWRQPDPATRPSTTSHPEAFTAGGCRQPTPKFLGCCRMGRSGQLRAPRWLDGVEPGRRWRGGRAHRVTAGTHRHQLAGRRPRRSLAAASARRHRCSELVATGEDGRAARRPRRLKRESLLWTAGVHILLWE